MDKILTNDIKIFGLALQNFLKKDVQVHFFKTFMYAEDETSKVKYAYETPIDNEFIFEYNDFMSIYKLCSIDKDNNKISIKIKDNNATVKYLKISKTVTLYQSNRDINIPILGEEIQIDIIDKAVIATSAIKNNGTFYHSKIIDVYSDGDNIMFSLTDGASIFFYKTKTENNPFRMQIPIRRIIKLKNTVEFKSFSISTDNKFICINGGNLKAYSLLSSAKFIDMTKESYQKMLRMKDNIPTFIIDRQKLRDEIYSIKVALSNKPKNESSRMNIIGDNGKYNIDICDMNIELESINGDGNIDVMLDINRMYNVVNSMKSKTIKMQVDSMALIVDENGYKIGIAKMRNKKQG